MGNAKSKRRQLVQTNTISLKVLPTAPLPCLLSESVDCQTETLSSSKPAADPPAEPLSSPRAESFEGSVGSLKSSNANVSHVNVQGNSGGGGESQHVVSQVYSNLMSGIIEPQPSQDARATFYEPQREDRGIFKTQ